MPQDGSKFWNWMARRYAANPISDTAGYQRTLDLIAGHLGPESRVYEFGCGPGTTALRLAPDTASYFAVDYAERMITIAEERAAAAPPCPSLRFAVGHAQASGLAPASVDVAIGFNILHLLPDRPALHAEMLRILKPGGLLITKTPCLAEATPLLRLVLPVMRTLGFAPPAAFFTAAELAAEQRAAGFEIVQELRHGSKTPDRRIVLVARKSA
ncbi:class I SAM-dependent methyltransferase [Oryzibacter oryziterrae]|uniref:class I SAM-dependent methyltransferase n=1 Tax=Oryzibacter oryziterrae TaxID=2766474 RepID=UPI001F3E4DB8|nr:class I SAM-dependent methyltransferase [Oryzibacter oryziterrae]